MKKNPDISNQLSNWFEHLIQNKNIKRLIPFEASKWLGDQEEFIDWISELPPAGCYDLWDGSTQALSRVKGDNHNLDEPLPYYSCALIDVLTKGDYWKSLQSRVDNDGTTMLRCGFTALSLLADRRVGLYMVEKGTINQFHVAYGNIEKELEDPRIEKVITDAYEALEKNITLNFSNQTNLLIYNREENICLEQYTNVIDMHLPLAKILSKNFPKDDIRGSIIAAAEGRKDIRDIPKTVAWGLRKEYASEKVVKFKKTKKDEIKLRTNANKDEDIFNQKNKYGSDKVIVEVEKVVGVEGEEGVVEAVEVLEVVEATKNSPLVDIAKTVEAAEVIQLIKDKDLLNGKIAELCRNGRTDREIAKMLPISKSEVCRRRQNIEAYLEELNSKVNPLNK